MFHSLFENRSEIESGLVDPFQPITVNDFRKFVSYFLDQGYSFVSPDQIIEGLDPDVRYIFVTFDDGYANNLRAVPVAREFNIPITIFVSTNYVIQQRSFWWDVHYRERMRQGLPTRRIKEEQERLKKLPNEEIIERLKEWFGSESMAPISDLDRPMLASELELLSKEPLVTIGNHTANHAILTLLDESEIMAQIASCQKDLEAIIGETPRIIAYPNGNHDDRIISICRQLGFKLGVTTTFKKTDLPLDARSDMRIGRFELSGGPTVIGQCQVFQAGVRIVDRLQRVLI